MAEDTLFGELPDTLVRGGAHANPLWDYLGGFVPRKLKDTLRLSEYVYTQSPHIFAAVSKLSDYSITDIDYKSEAESERRRTKELMEDSLGITGVLKSVSRDRMVYGNAFVSVYLPFHRMMKCKACNTSRNIEHIEYKFKWKDLSFRWTCPACHASVSTTADELEDTRNPDFNKINIIRFDPKLIDIDFNPLTGHSLYYLNISKDIKTKVQQGAKHLLNTMPVGFLKAIKGDKLFKFAEGQLFHLKVDSLAGMDHQWGMPPLVATFKQFLYTATLRKANESIALEHVVPFRVLHPAQAGSNSDPTMMISLANWQEQTKQNIKKWRRDPLHIMLSPVALGVTQMGGDGRALLTLAEVESAENNILASMGVPREFLYGGLSFTGSSVTLRMLENQLANQTKDLEGLMTWICKKATSYLGWPSMKLELVPFKLIDDTAQKQALLALNQTGSVISNTTLAKIFGYDLTKERDLRKQEAIDEQRFNTELQTVMQHMSNSLSNQARAKAQQGQASMGYDISAVLGAADQMVEQFMGLDPGTRRSQLQSLGTEDPVMHAVVVQRMQEYQKQQATAARQQVTQGSQN